MPPEGIEPAAANHSTLLLTNNLYQHTFSALSVKLAVKNLFPLTKMKLPLSYRYDNLASHYLPLHVSIGIYLALIMLI
jgi:hypothetical protein